MHSQTINERNNIHVKFRNNNHNNNNNNNSNFFSFDDCSKSRKKVAVFTTLMQSVNKI